MDQKCNNNNNKKKKEEEEDNVYGALIMQSTSRVHPAHMMDMERRQAAADPQQTNLTGM